MAVRLDLDDLDLRLADPEDWLRRAAGAGARVRTADAASRAAGLTDGDRPRAVVVAGDAWAPLVAQCLVALVGATSPTPIVAAPGRGLPAFVGPLDLVLCVAATPVSAAAVAVVEEAGRRGAQLVGVAPPGGSLGDALARARAVVVDIGAAPAVAGEPGLLWSLLVPCLHAVAGAGLLALPEADVVAAAARLDAVAISCRPDADLASNVAKTLAAEFAAGVPVLWGQGLVPVAAAAVGAQRIVAAACRPALSGPQPDAADPALGLLAGGRRPAGDPDDFFRDRSEEGDAAEAGPVVVLLADIDDDPAVGTALRGVAEEHGLVVLPLVTAGDSRLERLASVIGILDFAAVYTALAAGREPGRGHLVERLSAHLRAYEA